MHLSSLVGTIRAAIDSVGERDVTGIIGEVTVSSSHHAYFTMTAEGCQIRCIMHRGYWLRRQEPVPSKGDSVTLTGTLSFYAKKGEMQLIVTAIKTTPSPTE